MTKAAELGVKGILIGIDVGKKAVDKVGGLFGKKKAVESGADKRFENRPGWRKATDQDARTRATDQDGIMRCVKCGKEVTGDKQMENEIIS